MASSLLALQLAWSTEIVNGSFETGDFTGWVTQDLAIPFVPLQVGGAGLSPGFGFFRTAPTDGMFVALHGFDGSGPGHIRIAQDITVLPRVATIEFDYRGAWDLITFCSSCADRIFDVTIEEAGGGAILANQNILIVRAGTAVSDTGPQVGSIDLSAFAGRTVRLCFDFFVLDESDEPDLDAGFPTLQGDDVAAGILKWDLIIGIAAPGDIVGSGSGLMKGAAQPWSAVKGRAMLDLDSGDTALR